MGEYPYCAVGRIGEAADQGEGHIQEGLEEGHIRADQEEERILMDQGMAGPIQAKQRRTRDCGPVGEVEQETDTIVPCYYSLVRMDPRIRRECRLTEKVRETCHRNSDQLDVARGTGR